MFKTTTCIALHCDHCGKPLEDDDTYGIVHFENEQQAIDLGTSSYEWRKVGSRVFCTADDCAIAAIDADGVVPVLLPGQLEIGGAA